MEKFTKAFKGKKFLIWDFDGTIAELDVDWDGMKAELLKVLRKHGVSLDSKQSLNDIINHYAMLGKRKTGLGIVRKYESKAKFSIRKEALDFIANSKHRMAIFSDNMGSVVRKILKTAGLLEYFGLIIGKDDVEKFKPHPEGLELIANYFKCHDKKKYLFIGNSDKDEICSKNFGIEFIYLDNLK